MAVTCNQKGRERWLSPEEKFKVSSPAIVVEGFGVMEEIVDLIVPKTVVEVSEVRVKKEKKKKIITPKRQEHKKKVTEVEKDDWL